MMEVHLPYSLTKDEVLAKAKLLLSAMAKAHQDLIKNLSENWQGYTCSFSFQAKGKNISGWIEVRESEVFFKADLPFLFKLMKGEIEANIRDEWYRLLLP
ncbi:MAG: polyhydroxyalkanoic acid system family protein [Patescibacteria group bacterium]|nr:polyhydroxyalkanoic acid system family protein [Patescibacteria group bacterium]